MQVSIAQSLSQSRLMAGLPAEVMDSLAERFDDAHDVPAGEVFKKAGDAADTAYLVRSGNVQVSESRGLADGAYAYTIGQGEIVGVPALLDGGEDDAEFRAAEDTTLASLGRSQFDDWLASYEEYRSALVLNAGLDQQQVILLVKARMQYQSGTILLVRCEPIAKL